MSKSYAVNKTIQHHPICLFLGVPTHLGSCRTILALHLRTVHAAHPIPKRALLYIEQQQPPACPHSLDPDIAEPVSWVRGSGYHLRVMSFPSPTSSDIPRLADREGEKEAERNTETETEIQGPRQIPWGTRSTRTLPAAWRPSVPRTENSV